MHDSEDCHKDMQLVVPLKLQTKLASEHCDEMQSQIETASTGYGRKHVQYVKAFANEIRICKIPHPVILVDLGQSGCQEDHIVEVVCSRDLLIGDSACRHRHL